MSTEPRMTDALALHRLQLAWAGQRRRRLEAWAVEHREAMAQAVREAEAAGMGRGEAAALVGISRQGLWELVGPGCLRSGGHSGKVG